MKKICGLFGILTLFFAIGCKPAEEPVKKDGGASSGSNTTLVAPASDLQLS